MNLENVAIFILLVAIFIPWIWVEVRDFRRSRRVFHPDPVARKHRAVIKRGFKSRMGAR